MAKSVETYMKTNGTVDNSIEKSEKKMEINSEHRNKCGKRYATMMNRAITHSEWIDLCHFHVMQPIEFRFALRCVPCGILTKIN